MAFLNKGLTISLRDERAGHVDEKGEVLEVKYCYAGGIVDFVKHLNTTKGVAHKSIIAFETEDLKQKMSLEVAMQWNTSFTESVYTFANTINTQEGGTHEEGFRTSLTSLVNKFTWNGTSSGVCLPDANWIKDDRKGLTICDATSSVFAMPMDWKKLDVITWSWQKVLGGEGGHGMIALSPKALERLRTYQPSWPIPKIFRLAEDKKVLEGVFEGETINTPSMLCVEDCVDALLWIQSIGGSEGAIKRSKKNLEEVKFFVKENKDWIDFLAEKENTISSTSICLKITDPNFKKLSKEDQTTKLKTINQILEKENIAYDVNSYRTAPAGFRIWGGATVESTDIEKLLPWIKWAYLTNLNV